MEGGGCGAGGLVNRFKLRRASEGAFRDVPRMTLPRKVGGSGFLCVEDGFVAQRRWVEASIFLHLLAAGKEIGRKLLEFTCHTSRNVPTHS